VLTLTAVWRGSALYDRHGIVRLPRQAMSGLGVVDGSVVLLRGRKPTGALAVTAPADSPPGHLLCDDLVLSNLGLQDGDTVVVEAARRVEARRITVAGPDGVSRAVPPEVLRTALLGKVVMTGDQVSLKPSDLAPPADFARLRESLSAGLGAGWTSQILHVTDSEPAGPAMVTMGTIVGWQDGTTTTGAATPPAPAAPLSANPLPKTLADLPGLESQGAALKEWLDLGFHHRDLPAR
jgi:transitional endoplasmic reticulum ATPase